jgi:hypothetical protein
MVGSPSNTARASPRNTIIIGEPGNNLGTLYCTCEPFVFPLPWLRFTVVSQFAGTSRALDVAFGSIVTSKKQQHELCSSVFSLPRACMCVGDSWVVEPVPGNNRRATLVHGFLGLIPLQFPLTCLLTFIKGTCVFSSRPQGALPGTPERSWSVPPHSATFSTCRLVAHGSR